MIRLEDILREVIEEKDDRCLRIARRKYSKPSAYRSGAIVRCRQGKIWKGLKEGDLEKSLRYVKPNFEYEWGEEAVRYPEFKEMGKEGWINLANQGHTVYYSDIKDVLGNVYLNFNNLESDKKARFKKAFNSGIIEIPIAVKFDDIDYDLVAGNTRLAGLVSLGIDPKIWIVDLSRENLDEIRQGLLDYLKQQLPNTPEYVIKDMIYRSLKTAHNAGDIDQEYIEQFKDIKWELETNFPITMDIFTDKTKKELESRIGGNIRKDIPGDEERLQLQRTKLKSQGISKEPIILLKAKNGKYDLAEGKHRTIEAFKLYPEGFIQPNVYIGLNAPWLNEAKKESLHKWFSRQGGEGKAKGWVDCNTCREVDGKKKCKPCGRQEGETRAKYPSCRPTPSQCSRPGKGKTWGKTK